MSPNILLIHSDQHRYDALACHGHPQVRTPTLDQLARDGVDFQRAFTPSPICTPARACLLTGRWPTQHGLVCIPNTEIYRCPHDLDPTLWRKLRERGYQQALIGKWHNETPRNPSAYIDRFVSEHAYADWRASHGLMPQPRTNGWFGNLDPHITPDQHRLAWEAGEVTATISQFHQSRSPWMVRWDPSEPHLPNIIPESMKDAYPPESITPWPSFFDTQEGKPFIQRQQRRTWGVDAWGWDKWAPVVSRYLAEIELMDRQIGRVLDHLDRLGLREQTLVIYSTDHGDYCGGHGQMDKHFSAYDDLMRVPLLMRWPGTIRAGAVCDEFVSHELDLNATILKLVTGSVPQGAEGVDLLPSATGVGGTGRRDIFAQYQGTQFGLYSQRMLRTDRWKYAWNPTDIDELYDLDSDPAELTNLAQDPAHRETLMDMRRRLIHWMEPIRDPLLNEFTRVQLTRYGVKP